jgi:hypothetical protein
MNGNGTSLIVQRIINATKHEAMGMSEIVFGNRIDLDRGLLMGIDARS